MKFGTKLVTAGSRRIFRVSKIKGTITSPTGSAVVVISTMEADIAALRRDPASMRYRDAATLSYTGDVRFRYVWEVLKSTYSPLKNESAIIEPAFM